MAVSWNEYFCGLLSVAYIVVVQYQLSGVYSLDSVLLLGLVRKIFFRIWKIDQLLISIKCFHTFHTFFAFKIVIWLRFFLNVSLTLNFLFPPRLKILLFKQKCPKKKSLLAELFVFIMIINRSVIFPFQRYSFENKVWPELVLPSSLFCLSCTENSKDFHHNATFSTGGYICPHRAMEPGTGGDHGVHPLAPWSVPRWSQGLAHLPASLPHALPRSLSGCGH